MTDQELLGLSRLDRQARVMPPWLRAGLAGGIAFVLLSTLNLIPYFVAYEARALLSACLCIPFLFAYPAVGALAAHWLAAPRAMERAALAGGLAGLVAGGIDAVFGALAHIVLAYAGVFGRYLSQTPAAELDNLRRSALGAMYTPRGLLVCGLLQAPPCLVWAIAWAAVGGLVYAALRPGLSSPAPSPPGAASDFGATAAPGAASGFGATAAPGGVTDSGATAAPGGATGPGATAAPGGATGPGATAAPGGATGPGATAAPGAAEGGI